QSAFEAGNKALFQVGDLACRTITGKHDLLPAIGQRIERMEKFFLGTFFAGQKVNIVDQQDICLTIALPKSDKRVVLDRIDELIDEPFAREIHYLLGLSSFDRLLAD